MTNIVYRFIEFSDEEFNIKFDHLGNSVRNIIRKEEGEKGKVLLDYPVVYVHTWKEKEKLYVYVGETINLVRRTNQHFDNENEKAWQIRWKNGNNHVSAYFSSDIMNKSLALDLEDSLIAIFQKIEERDNQKLHIVNGRDNQQLGYSNKNLRDGILKELWEKLNNRFGILPEYDEVIKEVTLSKGKCSNSILNPVCDDLQICGWAFNIKNEKDIDEFFDDKADIFTCYPVVYMHIWMDENRKMHTYTGETNNIIERTKQHFNSNTIVKDFDLWLNEADYDWHDEWIKAVNNKKAYMYVFGHKDMNISVTRDIENYLIRYTILCGLSSNGRKNEQRKYENNEKAYELFKRIVSGLHERMININCKDFLSLEEIKKKSAFMASPLLNLSDEQSKIKDEIIRQVVECDNAESHKLFLVEGEAGTGKTVLISSLFFDLADRGNNIKLFINHAELFNAYIVQADARDLTEHSLNNTLTSSITKAESWINYIKGRYIETILRFFEKKDQNEIVEALGRDITLEETRKKLSEKFEKNMLKCPQKNIIKLDWRKAYMWDRIKILIDLAEEKGIDISIVKSETSLDVALIDEAHLLANQGKNGGIKEAQLPIIADNSRLLIVMGDAKQYVDSGTKITYDNSTDYEMVEAYRKQLKNFDKDDIVSLGKLTTQHRMRCSENIKMWLKSLYTPNTNGEIKINVFPISSDNRHSYEKEQDSEGNIFIYEKDDNTGKLLYEIGLFSKCASLTDKIGALKKKNNPTGLIASYCWKYENKKDNFIFKDENGMLYKWHRTGEGSEETNIWTMEKVLKDKEGYIKVRSFHDVQGFDLNYAGVIIGNSLESYKSENHEEKVRINPNVRPGISNNTLNANELIQNELNVLLSRGVKGLYIYAVDDGLREVLFNSVIDVKKNI